MIIQLSRTLGLALYLKTHIMTADQRSKRSVIKEAMKFGIVIDLSYGCPSPRIRAHCYVKASKRLQIESLLACILLRIIAATSFIVDLSVQLVILQFRGFLVHVYNNFVANLQIYVPRIIEVMYFWMQIAKCR